MAGSNGKTISIPTGNGKGTIIAAGNGKGAGIATANDKGTGIATGNGNATIIDVKNVVKSFPVGGSSIVILKGISFSVKRGEFVSIVGPAGNGKSTVLNMITGIDRPTSG